jgi:hypothetical protein
MPYARTRATADQLMSRAAGAIVGQQIRAQHAVGPWTLATTDRRPYPTSG